MVEVKNILWVSPKRMSDEILLALMNKLGRNVDIRHISQPIISVKDQIESDDFVKADIIALDEKTKFDVVEQFIFRKNNLTTKHIPVVIPVYEKELTDEGIISKFIKWEKVLKVDTIKVLDTDDFV